MAAILKNIVLRKTLLKFFRTYHFNEVFFQTSINSSILKISRLEYPLKNIFTKKSTESWAKNFPQNRVIISIYEVFLLEFSSVDRNIFSQLPKKFRVFPLHFNL
jgi:hypothetical protein